MPAPDHPECEAEGLVYRGAACHKSQPKRSFILVGPRLSADRGRPLMSDVVPSEVSPPAQRKLYLISYGCQLNDYDSAQMADVLTASHAHARPPNPDPATPLLLHTLPKAHPP